MIWFRRLFFTLVAIAMLQVIYYYPQMPDVVASHFDGRGAPNGWASRNGFFGIYLAMILILIAVFVLVPRWAESGSRFAMKIPHRDYWLAPERIEQTRAFLRRQMLVIGSAHLLLMIYAIQLAIMANFELEPRLHPSIGWALALYFVALVAWLIHLFRYFRKP